jgi:hypothetical protein
VTSSVDITNRALQAIGTRSTIAAMTEGSNESNNAQLAYDATRQALIRAAPWNFASATAQLALLKSAPGTTETPLWPASGVWSNVYPQPGWSYQYAYPADCLRVRKVVPNYSAPQGMATPLFPTTATSALPYWDLPGMRFQVATDTDVSNNPYTCILANIDQAIGCYLRDITIEDLWDASFTEAMVVALAGRLALALTSNQALAKDLFGHANQLIIEARADDGNEGLTIIDRDADWITQGHGVRWMAPTTPGYVYPYGPLLSAF